MIVTVKVYTKLFNLWPSRHFFGVYISYEFLAIFISKRYPFFQRFAAGKCKANKRQLQIIYGNMIKTDVKSVQSTLSHLISISACHVYPISRGALIISILFIVNRFTWGLNLII